MVACLKARTAVETGARPIPVLTDAMVYTLAIDPATPTTLYAGTEGTVCSKAQTAVRTGVRVNTGLTMHTYVNSSGDRPVDAGHPICRNSCRRHVQKYEWRRELDHGQHWTDPLPLFTVLAIDPADTDHSLCWDNARRYIQKHEWWRELECGQHRTDYYTDV